jgi:hypothetical protein
MEKNIEDFHRPVKGIQGFKWGATSSWAESSLETLKGRA